MFDKLFKKIGEWMDNDQNSSMVLIACGIIAGALMVHLVMQIGDGDVMRDIQSAARDYMYIVMKD